jgi:P27 family predicted phage terminase small subunit
MPGRRPTPTALKIATGNPGKRATNKREPKADGIPVPPDHLSDGARRAWFALCPLLASMGIIAKADGIAFERLCECYAEVNELQAALRDGGRVQVVITKSGDSFERQRPQVAMLADADRRLKGYLVEFGLSPAARSKVNVAEQEEQSAAADYF